MKLRKTALLTTCMMLMTSAAAMPSVQAAEDPLFGTLPDWVPQDFADAMQFYNSYGKSYIADNIICLVRPMLQWKEDDYQTSLSGSMTLIDTPAGSQPKIYELDIPEKPDPDDSEAVKAYQEYCRRLGLDSYDYSFFEAYAGCRTQYAFGVELFRVLKGYDLTVTWSEKEGDAYKKTEVFSFENSDGTTTETDLYGWLPDSRPEFKVFSDHFGKASVQGNYIAYCANVNASTGASLQMTQSGEGEIKEVLKSSCNDFYLVPTDGAGSASVILYQPTKDGTLDVKWTVGREWSGEMEPYETTNGSYEILDDCSVILDRKTVFTFFDADTGKLIDIPKRYVNCAIEKFTPDGSILYSFKTNPCTIGGLYEEKPDYHYSAYMIFPAGVYGIYGDPEFEITSEETDRVTVNCRLKWEPSGDANGDNDFTIADLVLLQKWLLAEPDTSLSDWNAVDFCRDNKINASDLSLMKRELLSIKYPVLVEPDHTVEFGTMLAVTVKKLYIYLGPDESYPTAGFLNYGASIRELGYQEGNNDWLYTEYGGQYGWIRTVLEDGVTRTVEYAAAPAKPVIYLYPEQETDVHVELELTEAELRTTYPKYNNGWDVTAYPDGTLLNKADGTQHRYLFWDAVNCRTRFDFSRGFCIAGSDTERFLKEKLAYMGLTEQERNEFIVYWLPLMEHNAYNLISFQGDAYTDSAKLTITPAPDSECRIFMAYVPLENPVKIEPQQLTPFERKGFSVVEWGGCEIR